MTSKPERGRALLKAQRLTLTLQGAKALALAAEAEALRQNCVVSIAIVDDAGHLLYLQRDEAVLTVAIDVSIGKARTAAMFRKPTKEIETLIDEKRTALLSAPGIVALGGGAPIVIDGQFVGGIGVSGASAAQDIQIAEIALAAIS